MPIYEYECTACGHRYDKLVKIGGEAPPCPECASADVRKLISQSGFILKGGGWYKDHYGLKKGGDRDAGGSKSDSKPDAKADATKKSDAPAPKTETKAAAAK